MVEEIYLKKLGLWFSVIVSLGFVMIGVWLLQFPRQPGEGFFHVYGPGIFFALLAGYGLYRIIFPKPMIVLRDDGIEENWPGGAGLIGWPEIDRLAFRSRLLHKTLVVVLRDPKSFCARASAARRAWWRLNNRLVGAEYRIRLSNLAVSGPDLAARASDRLAEFGRALPA